MARLNIKNISQIKGGSIDYTLEQPQGILTYAISVTVKIFFGWAQKTFSFKGETKVDPQILLSSSFKPGASFVLNGGKISIVCDTIGTDKDGKNVAHVSIIEHGNVSASGWAAIDLSLPVISIKEVYLSAKVPVFGAEIIHAVAQ